MRRTGTSHAPRAIPMSIHKIEIGVKPFSEFPHMFERDAGHPRVSSNTHCRSSTHSIF